MIRALPLATLDEVRLVPRATVAKPVEFFAKKFQLDLVIDFDELDRFEGLVLCLNNELPFMLSHHAGNDENQTVVSLPINIGTATGIAAAFGRITDELGIPDQWIVWQQNHDDPARKFA